MIEQPRMHCLGRLQHTVVGVDGPGIPAPERAGASTAIKEEEVLGKLRRIIDPDLGMDIVACGFVKNLTVDAATGAVAFVLELTTPACPAPG